MLPLKTLLNTPAVKKKLLIGAAVVAGVFLLSRLEGEKSQSTLSGAEKPKKMSNKKSAKIEL